MGGGEEPFYFTNNGGDMLGNNKPDDTLNRGEEGADYGYP